MGDQDTGIGTIIRPLSAPNLDGTWNIPPGAVDPGAPAPTPAAPTPSASPPPPTNDQDIREISTDPLDKLPDRAPPRPVIDDPLENLPDKHGKLEQNWTLIADTDPDAAARIITTAKKLDATTAQVADNLPAAEQAARKPDTDLFEELEKMRPGSTKFLSNLENMAQAQDDFEKLGFFESLFQQATLGWKKGNLETRSSELAEQQRKDTLARGSLSPLGQPELKDLDEQLRPLHEMDQRVGQHLHPIYQFMSMAPMMTRQIFQAGAGSEEPQVGPAAKAGILGASKGSKGLALSALAAHVQYLHDVTAGQAYREYLDLKNPDGSAVDPVRAAEVAGTVGQINAALQLGGDAAQTAVLLPFAKAASGATGLALRTIAKMNLPWAGKIAAYIGSSPEIFAGMTLGQAVREAGKTFLHGTLSQVAPMYAQTAVTGLGGQVASGKLSPADAAIELNNAVGRATLGEDVVGDNSNPDAKLDTGESFSNAMNVIWPAAQAGMVTGALGAGGHLFNFHIEQGRVKAAQKLLQDSAEAYQQMKLKDRNPEAAGEFVNDATENTPFQVVHVESDAFEKYFQSKGLEPEAAAKELGIGEQYRQAKESGRTVQIPLPTWLDKVVPSEHRGEMMKDAKWDEDHKSARELEEIHKAYEEEFQRLMKERKEKQASEPVNKAMREKLRAAGATPAEIREGALLHEVVLRNLARQKGVDPKALMDAYYLAIARDGSGDGETFQQPSGPRGPVIRDASELSGMFDPKFEVKEGGTSAHRVGNFFWRDHGDGTVSRMIRGKEGRFLQASPRSMPLEELPAWLHQNDWSGSVAKALGVENKDEVYYQGASFPEAVPLRKILYGQKPDITLGEALQLAHSDDIQEVAQAARFLDDHFNNPDPKVVAAISRVQEKLGEVIPKIQSTRFGTPDGNIWISRAEHNGKVGIGIGQDKESSVRDVLNGTSRWKTAPLDKTILQSPWSKSMLVVGSNNYLRTRMPFFVLQQYDAHLLFRPQGGDHYEIGLALKARVPEVQDKFVSVKTHDIKEGINKLTAAAVAELAPDAGSLEAGAKVSESDLKPSSRETQSRWVQNGIYRLPKISLRDTLQLEPHPEKASYGDDETYYQAKAPAPKPEQSDIGFYSQLMAEVQKMDFKTAPAQDLINRIKNLGGIKSAELENSGIIEMLQKVVDDAGSSPREQRWTVLEKGNPEDFGGMGFKSKEEAEKFITDTLKSDPDKYEVKELPEETNRTGKVSKEDIINHLAERMPDLQQVVLTEKFKSNESPMGSDVADLDWSEPEVLEPDSHEISDESQYYLEHLHDYFGEEEVEKERRDIQSDIIEDYATSVERDEDGELKRDEDGNITGVVWQSREKKLSFEARVDDRLTDHYSQQAYDMAYESLMESESATQRVVESTTGWELTGNDENGWYCPDIGRELHGNLEEAKVELIQEMIDRGEVAGDLADALTAEDVDWTPHHAVAIDSDGKRRAGHELTNSESVIQQAKALARKDRARLLPKAREEAQYVLTSDTYTIKEKHERVEAEILDLAKNEIIEKMTDPENAENLIGANFEVGPVKGYIQGKKGQVWQLIVPEKRTKSRFGTSRVIRERISEGLNAATLEQAKADALRVLREHKFIAPEEAPALEGEAQRPDINKPTGPAKWASHSLKGGENYREILITLPNNPGKSFNAGHFSQPNVVIHIRVKDRVGPNGERMLFIEEIQSDWQQKGRQQGFRSEFPSDISTLEEAQTKASAAREAAEEKLFPLLQAADNLGYESRRLGLQAILEHKDFAERWEMSPELKTAAEEVRRATDAERSANADYNETRRSQPDMPFKDSEHWMGIAIKRMVRYAAEQGYDSIGLTRGDVHTERWGTEAIHWEKKTGTWFEVKSTEKDGTPGPMFKTKQEALKWAREKEFYIAEAEDGKGGYDIRRISDAEIVHAGYNNRFQADHALEHTAALPLKQYSIEENNEPHYLVSSTNQSGGNVVGMNLEEAARERGLLVEKNGQRVTSRDELKELLKDDFGGDRNRKEYDRFIDNLWKKMQAEPEGQRLPRKEGYEFEYDHVLPKKSFPAALKKLGDKSAKVEMAEIKVPEDPDRAKVRYEGPELTVDQIDAIQPPEKSGEESVRELRNRLVNTRNANFHKLAAKYLTDEGAKILGGKITRSDTTREKIHYVKLTPEMKQKALEEGFPLFQKAADDSPRGQIEFAANLAGTSFDSFITLFKDANKSTFLHESGHYFLKVLEHMAGEEGAPDSLKQHYADIRKWLGVEDGETIHGEHHEKFARAFEAYLMEGKAPVPELRGAFRRFRQWLTKIYENAKQLLGGPDKVSPEVRSIMDRLFATQEELNRAEGEVGLTPFPTEGLDPSVVGKLQDLQERARTSAEESLIRAQMTELKEKNKPFLEAERKRITEEVTGQVKALPIWNAAQTIKEASRIRATELAHLFLEDRVTDKVAAKFEEAAVANGFVDGQDLARKLVEADTHGGMDQEIKAATDAEMQRLHAPMMDTEAIRVQAMQAVHNERSTELLALEKQVLQSLVEKAGVQAEATRRNRFEAQAEAKAAADTAEKALSRMPVKEATNVRAYTVAERNAALKAQRAMLSKDYEAASQAKRQQLVAHAMASRAMKNKAALGKAMDYLQGDVANPQKMPPGFVQQIEGILGKAGLKEPTPKDLETHAAIAESMLQKGDDPFAIANLTGLVREESGQWRPETLPEFVNRVNDDYFGIDLPVSVLGQQERPFKELSFQEALEIRDAVKTIAEAGKRFDRFTGAFDKVNILEAAKEFATSVLENYGAPEAQKLLPGAKDGTRVDLVVDNLLSLPAGLNRQMDNILAVCDKLDGFEGEGLIRRSKDGPAKKYIYRPMSEAEGKRSVRMRKAMADMEKLFSDHYTQEEFGKYKDTRIKIEGRVFTKDEVLVMALNWGNEGNRDRLMRGFGWTESQVEEAFSHLDKKDWDFAQAVGDYLHTFWPEIVALELKMTGSEPKGVEPAPFTNKHGSYRGWYYPIAYDFEKSSEAFKNAEQKTALYKQFGAASAQTDQGHTKSRVDSLNRPLRLSLDVLHNHVEDVIHDLEFREPVVDLARFLKQRDTRQAIQNALGVRGYAGFSEWLKAVASSPSEPMGYGEQVARWLRFRAVFFNMAYRIASGLKIGIENLNNMASEVGMSQAARALNDYYLGDGLTHETVIGKSPFMRERAEHLDRDLGDISDRWRGNDKGNFYKFGFFVHAFLDQGASFPLWSYVYKEALSNHGDEKLAIHQADEAIKRTFMSGGIVDQAPIMRGSEKQKALTTAFGYQSMMWNRYSRQRAQIAQEWNAGNTTTAIAIAARAHVYTFLMPAAVVTLTSAITSNSRSGNDEEMKKRLLGRFIEESTPMKFIPVARDVFPYLVAKAIGESQRDLQVTPLERAAQTLLDPAAEMFQATFGDKALPDRFPEQVVNAISLVKPFPKQFNDVVFNFLDWQKGNGELTFQDFMQRRTKK